MRRPLPIAPMASCFALTGFAIAILSGLASEDAASDIIEGALMALVLCYIVASIVAKGYALILREHLDEHAHAHPVPSVTAPFDAEPIEVGEYVEDSDTPPSQEAEAA